MKKAFLLFFAFGIIHFSRSQEILVDIPINKTAGTTNVANPDFISTFMYGTKNFRTDRLGSDSAALLLGLRQWLDIAVPVSAAGMHCSEIRFSLWLKMDSDNKVLPLQNSYNVVLGQQGNIGIVYNYKDSTLLDYKKNVIYKLQDPYTWHKIELVYAATIALWVDGAQVGSALSGSIDYVIEAGKLQCGGYDYMDYDRSTDYLFALVDELKIAATKSPALATEHPLENKIPSKVSYMNLQGQVIAEVANNEKPSYLKGIFIVKKEFNNSVTIEKQLLE